MQLLLCELPLLLILNQPTVTMFGFDKTKPRGSDQKLSSPVEWINRFGIHSNDAGKCTKQIYILQVNTYTITT